MRKKGFTLIELLVVIAIIALLLSIILPSLNTAKRKVQRIVCGAQLRQWAPAFSAYSMDNDGYFPYNLYTKPEWLSDSDPWWAAHHTSWVSTYVAQFWENYLMKADSGIAEGKSSALFCPTNKYHMGALANLNAWRQTPLSGYCYLPYRYPFVTPPTGYSRLGANYAHTNYQPAPENPRGNEWVAKPKMYGKYYRHPIVMDLMQAFGPESDGDIRWSCVNYPPLAQLRAQPFSNHTRGVMNEPDGGNFLFEGGQVVWYNFGEIDLGAHAGPGNRNEWNWYYSISEGN